MTGTSPLLCAHMSQSKLELGGSQLNWEQQSKHSNQDLRRVTSGFTAAAAASPKTRIKGQNPEEKQEVGSIRL